MQRGAAKLVLEVDVRVSIEEQLGDVVVVLGTGVEQRRATLDCHSVMSGVSRQCHDMDLMTGELLAAGLVRSFFRQ